jgi:Trypsin-like peptidase domain
MSATSRATIRFVPLVLIACALGIGLPSTARAEPLDAGVLKKLKAGTVLLQVKLTDGRAVQGSGFFTDEPGLIVTSARVLHMLDPDSRKPVQVDVTVTDAQDKSRTLTAKVVGVDRGSDVALIRVEDKDLPEPLALGVADEVKETDTVIVFGFPFVQDLGKEITVTKSAVSKVIKTPGGKVNRLQLDGGINPGTAGGPVVNGKGEVVGIAVSGVKGSQIGFALSTNWVTSFLTGRLSNIIADVPVKGKDDEDLKLPITFEFVDPLARLQKVEVEVWTGNADNAYADSAKEPDALPGDSPKKKFDMKYEKKPSVSLDVPVPALTDPKQVWWIRPVVTNGRNETLWLRPMPKKSQPPLERRAIALKYNPPVKDKQTGDLISRGGFKIRDEDGTESSLDMNFRAALTEQFADAEAKVFPLRLTYDRFVLDLKVDGKPVKDNKDVQRILGDVRFLAANVDMDKDGGVFNARGDLTQVPKASREALGDVSDQVLESFELMSIPLPDHKLEAGETWKARRDFQIGPGFIAVAAQGDLVYKYRGVQVRSGKEVVLIGIEGQLRGKRGDGTNLGGNVHGAVVLDPETGVPIHADATVKADVDFTFGRKAAKATGTLSVSVDRPAKVPAPPEK